MEAKSFAFSVKEGEEAMVWLEGLCPFFGFGCLVYCLACCDGGNGVAIPWG